MVTEKQKQINEMLKSMEDIMKVKGNLPVVHAINFLERGFSISERFKEMEISRDTWKDTAQEYSKILKSLKKCSCSFELCPKHQRELEIDGRTMV